MNRSLRSLLPFLLVALPAPAVAQSTSKPTSQPAASPAAMPKDAKKTASGLEYAVLRDGKGSVLQKGDLIEVHFDGWLSDGKQFASTRQAGQPMRVVVGNRGLIAGLNEGLTLMKVGSRCKFRIPPGLAYGRDGAAPAIPGDATVVYDMEVTHVLCGAPKFFGKLDPKKSKVLASGVSCEIVEEGVGKSVGKEMIYELGITRFDASGTLLESSATVMNTIKAKLSLFNQAFLQEIIPTLKVGRVVRLEIPAGKCLPQGYDADQYPWNGKRFWELRLVRVTVPLKVPDFRKPDDKKSKTTKEGLVYEVLKAGKGKQATIKSVVTVHYSGWTLDGKSFDSSYERSEVATFPLGNVIPGWQIGIPLMKEGSVFLFRIPAMLAYADEGPPHLVGKELVFHVELLEVKDK